MTILQEAEKLINGERQKDYGDAQESLHRIALLWSAYTNYPITAYDVAVMMALLKFARLKHSRYTHRDSVIDAAGYIGLLEKIS